MTDATQTHDQPPAPASIDVMPERAQRGWATAWAVLRVAMAGFIAAAVVAQLAASVTTATDLGRDVPTTVVNFFSFFTVLSNVLASAVLMWAGVRSLASRANTATSLPLATALAAVTSFMVITGVVYNVLLRSVELPQGSAPIPWSNETLHLIAPAFLVLDLLCAPRGPRLPWKALWVVLTFPIVWATYTLIRGPLTVNPATSKPYWYPYPFLDPNGPGGWVSVLTYVVGITCVFVLVGLGVIAWSRRTSTFSVAANASSIR